MVPLPGAHLSPRLPGEACSAQTPWGLVTLPTRDTAFGPLAKLHVAGRPFSPRRPGPAA